MILFTYKKDDKIRFLEPQQAQKLHDNMTAGGFQHISTIHSPTYLNDIANILCDKKMDDQKKVRLIRELLEAE